MQSSPQSAFESINGFPARSERSVQNDDRAYLIVTVAAILMILLSL